MRKHYLLALNFLVLSACIYGQGQFRYQVPDKVLGDLFTENADDEFIFSGNGKWLVQTRTINYPSVKDISFVTIKAAGLYVDAANYAPAVQHFAGALMVKDCRTGKERFIKGLPADLHAGHISWSPDGNHLAFTQTLPGRVDLYRIDLLQAKASRINARPLNIALGRAYQWMEDNSMLYKAVLLPPQSAPAASLDPEGVTLFDGGGTGSSPEGISKAALDTKLVEFYLSAQLVHNVAGKEIPFGPPAPYLDFSLSPDGDFVLSNTIEKTAEPLSSYFEFPSRVSILYKNGQPACEPLYLDDRLQNRPHEFGWRPGKPSTLTWIQPVDTGSQKGKGFSSIYYSWNAPFRSAPMALFKTQFPLQSVTWSRYGYALVTETDRARSASVTGLFREKAARLERLYEQGTYDLVNRMGSPVVAEDANGRVELQVLDKDRILVNNVSGNAASGNLPFLAAMDISTKTVGYIWKGKDKMETVAGVAVSPKPLLLMRIGDGGGGYEYHLQDTAGPLPKTDVLAVRRVRSPFDSATAQVIQYKRADGVTLSGTLFLPKGFDPARDRPLPLFIWGYPRRFYDRREYMPEAGTAKRYGIYIYTWEAPEMFVSQGYAVLYAGMPVLPDSTENANDHYIGQLLMNAEAAIKKLADDGIADPQRVAVGGHSYGGAMTALLLANSHLFKAGIAMSGDYNPLHTPFGFQDETRTYWQAKKVYETMGAISQADRIKTPLLLIHGADDQLPGTWAFESEGLFNAVKGNGGTVRYVRLPYELHGYRARENILHLVWEVNQWIDKYVKNGKPD